MTDTTIDSLADLTVQIVKWYEDDDRGFRTLFDKAVENVRPIPAGTPAQNQYDWKGKGIDDLCQFFVDWFEWLPALETGLEYIQKFSWLYYENIYGQAFVTTGAGLEMTQKFVELRGKYMDSKATIPLVKKWEKALGSEMDQFIVPKGGYRSFNEFFIREIKPGARPISDPKDDKVVVSPADALINMIVDDLSLETRIPVKTVYLNVREMLNDSPLADRFEGGTAVSCILMPNVYHRYHAPVRGHVVDSNQDVAGEYFGIKDFPDLLNKGDVGYGYDYSVFEQFRRGYVIIETSDYGHVGMVPVGLNTIASVVFRKRFRRIDPEKHKKVKVGKGEEIGYFQYGGSLNILLFEPGGFAALKVLQGQRIGLLSEPSH